ISPANRNSRVDDVTVVNNLFWQGSGSHAMLSAIRVGHHRGAPLPTNLRFISNTITTGVTSSINFDNGYALLPLASRPLVADNIAAVMLPKQCGNARWVDNLFAS